MNLIFTLGKEYFGTSKADAQANLLLSLTTCLIAFLESNICVFDVNMKQNSFQQTDVDMADNISNDEMLLKRRNSQDEGKETNLKDSKVGVKIRINLDFSCFLTRLKIRRSIRMAKETVYKVNIIRLIVQYTIAHKLCLEQMY